MSTKRAAFITRYTMITLILLGFLALMPLFANDSVYASESEISVDITQDDDNQIDSDSEQNSDNSGEESTEENNFEGDFPESYEPFLEDLQEEHPNWEFVPADTGMDWEDAVDKADEGSNSLIRPSAPKKQRENSKKTYDGGWYLASRDTIEHYMDPRNFLNDKGIYQFLLQTYEEDSQTEDSISSIIGGSFMDGADPKGDYDSYESCIKAAGANAGVNPNVLAAMIIQEQGWEGSSLVSGKKKGYEGYYNFFNIGAWTTDDMSSSERGLWYAKGSGEDATSHSRPWTSPYKAILGGAEFYCENYFSNNQKTYYTKKFNVMNGPDNVGSHEYMTNIEAAADEGKLVRKAYENSDLPATFEIPVYDNMPDDTCDLP